MKRKERTKLLACMITPVLVVLAFFVLFACSEEHTHTFDTKWTSNETHHWHAATCEHTELKEGEAEHVFDAGVVTKEATETEAGVRTFTCTVCSYRKTEEIPKLPHTHTFSEEWTTTETHHWHAATCEHTELKEEEGTHVFDDDFDPTCNVCGYTRVPAENRVVFSVEERTYNGRPQALMRGTDFATNGPATVYYKLADQGDDAYTVVAPTDAGEYTAKVVADGNALYQACTLTVDFSIERKLLTDIVVSKEYNGFLAASATLTAENGVISGDSVVVTVTTAADFTNNLGQFANAGNDKEVVSAEINNDNYILPEKSEITYNITPKQIDLSAGPLNASEYDYIWQFGSIPLMRYNIGYTGDDTLSFDYDFKVELPTLVGAEIVWNETTLTYAAEHDGTYRMTVTYTGKGNYLGDSYALLFEVKPCTEVNATDAVSVPAGETKAFLVSAPVGFYAVGRQLPSDAETEVFNRQAQYAIYNVPVEYFEGDMILVGRKLLIIVTAETAITSKLLVESVSYGGSYTSALDVGTHTVALTGTKGTWLTFYIDEGTVGEGDFRVEYNFGSADVAVYYREENLYRILPCPSGSVGMIYGQGSAIDVFIYCGDETSLNGTLTFTQVS